MLSLLNISPDTWRIDAFCSCQLYHLQCIFNKLRVSFRSNLVILQDHFARVCKDWCGKKTVEKPDQGTSSSRRLRLQPSTGVGSVAHLCFLLSSVLFVCSEKVKIPLCGPRSVQRRLICIFELKGTRRGPTSLPPTFPLRSPSFSPNGGQDAAPVPTGAWKSCFLSTGDRKETREELSGSLFFRFGVFRQWSRLWLCCSQHPISHRFSLLSCLFLFESDTSPPVIPVHNTLLSVRSTLEFDSDDSYMALHSPCVCEDQRHRVRYTANMVAERVSC